MCLTHAIQDLLQRYDRSIAREQSHRVIDSHWCSAFFIDALPLSQQRLAKAITDITQEISFDEPAFRLQKRLDRKARGRRKTTVAGIQLLMCASPQGKGVAPWWKRARRWNYNDIRHTKIIYLHPRRKLIAQPTTGSNRMALPLL